MLIIFIFISRIFSILTRANRVFLSLSLILPVCLSDHPDAIPCVSRLKMRTNFFLPLFSSFFIVENCCLFTFHSFRFDIHIATAAVTVVVVVLFSFFLFFYFFFFFSASSDNCKTNMHINLWMKISCMNFLLLHLPIISAQRDTQELRAVVRAWRIRRKNKYIVIKKSSLASWIESINTVWINERNEQNRTEKEVEEEEKITLYM